MRFEWIVGALDARRIAAFVQRMDANPFVQRRKRINLHPKTPVGREAFWHCMSCARLTTQQRSGPDSHVGRFVQSTPFALRYESVRASRNPKVYIAKALRGAGGIRFADTISTELASNLSLLEGGEWTQTLDLCNQLRTPGPRSLEQAIAGHIRTSFKGFGPKQSRNLLQSLGLTRYEIPIDSRVSGWLKEFGFPVRINAGALSDPDFYDLVSDGINILCEKADVYPCVLDAAVFASTDGDRWTTENAGN
jgi:hypothetical protein